jgi:hypothetical protein
VKTDVLHIPNSLRIERIRAREGPPVVYTVYRKGSSVVFTDPKAAIRYIKWPKSLPTGALIREWFEQFDKQEQPVELDKAKLVKEGFGPEAHSDGEDPTAATKMVV